MNLVPLQLFVAQTRLFNCQILQATPFGKGGLLPLHPKGALAEGMANKGGARHFSKPWIEPGLLLTVLTKHQDRVKDFGDYEVISAQGVASPKGSYWTS